MSDECLMKQETVFLFYTQYQAVMRKFTLAGKAYGRLLIQMLFLAFQHLFAFASQATLDFLHILCGREVLGNDASLG